MLAIGILSVNAFAQNVQPIAIGTPLPMAGTKMKATDGKEYSIKDALLKNGVLVMFSCNTCPYVIRYQGRTLAVIKEAKEKGIGVIIINSNATARDDEDSYPAMQEYGKAQGYKDVRYVVDDNSVVANAFGATRTPECFLFNAAGKLVYHGAIDDNNVASQAKQNYAIKALDETSLGKEVTVKETRSVGCMIKRP